MEKTYHAHNSKKKLNCKISLWYVLTQTPAGMDSYCKPQEHDVFQTCSQEGLDRTHWHELGGPHVLLGTLLHL